MLYTILMILAVVTLAVFIFSPYGWGPAEGDGSHPEFHDDAGNRHPRRLP